MIVMIVFVRYRYIHTSIYASMALLLKSKYKYMGQCLSRNKTIHTVEVTEIDSDKHQRAMKGE